MGVAEVEEAVKGRERENSEGKCIHSDAVGPRREASTGRFSRTATITGSFVALSRYCDKGGEECRGGFDH